MSNKKIEELLEKQNELLERQNQLLGRIATNLDIGLCFLPGDDLETFYKTINDRVSVPESARVELEETWMQKSYEREQEYFLGTMADLDFNNALKRYWGMPEKQWYNRYRMPIRKNVGEHEGPWEPDIPPPKNFADFLNQHTKLKGGKTMSRKAKHLAELIDKYIDKGIISGDRCLNAFLERGSKDSKSIELTKESFHKIILVLMSEDII